MPAYFGELISLDVRVSSVARLTLMFKDRDRNSAK